MGNTWEQLEALQPNVLKILQNSLLKERVAHAYLFEGSKGTGKKQISFCLLKRCFAKIQLIIGHVMSAVTAGELIQVIIQIFT